MTSLKIIKKMEKFVGRHAEWVHLTAIYCRRTDVLQKITPVDD